MGHSSDVMFSGLNPHIVFPHRSGPQPPPYNVINPGSTVRFSINGTKPQTLSLAGTEVMGSICANRTPPPANNPPLAALAVAVASIDSENPNRLVVHFDAGGSADPDGGDDLYWHDPLSYSWNFGDGTSEGPITANGFWEVHEYTLGGPATRTATLTVRDGRGDIDTASVTFALVPQTAPLTCSAYHVSNSATNFQLDTRIRNNSSAAISNPCVSLRFLDPAQVTGSTGGVVTNVSNTIKKVCLNGTLNSGATSGVVVQGTHDGSYDGSAFCNISVP
jgi:hypothetical protein